MTLHHVASPDVVDALVAEVREGLLQLRSISTDAGPSALSVAVGGAAAAMRAGADDDLAAAALLTDVGMAPAVRGLDPAVPAALAGARWCAEHLTPRVAWLVGAMPHARHAIDSRAPGAAEGERESAKRWLTHEWAEDALWVHRFRTLGAAEDIPERSLPARLDATLVLVTSLVSRCR